MADASVAFTIRFESEVAASTAAAELREAGYDVSDDQNNHGRGLRVECGAQEDEVDAVFERLGHLADRLGGEVDTWLVSRLEGFL